MFCVLIFFVFSQTFPLLSALLVDEVYIYTINKLSKHVQSRSNARQVSFCFRNEFVSEDMLRRTGLRSDGKERFTEVVLDRSVARAVAITITTGNNGL